ncbi:MAG: DUF5412 family protein [Candidatus Pristimantibacillus sp.]
MKKRYKILTIICAAIVLFIGYNRYFFTFNHLKADYYESPVESPEGTYSAKAYYVYYGGAAGGVNVAVDIINNKDNNAKGKTIYYADAQRQVYLEWKDEETIYIRNEAYEYPQSSRSIELNINKEIYHDTGLACDSWLLKGDYEACYEKD